MDSIERGLIISNRRPDTRSDTKQDACMGALKVSRTVIGSFWVTLLSGVSAVAATED